LFVLTMKGKPRNPVFYISHMFFVLRGLLLYVLLKYQNGFILFFEKFELFQKSKMAYNNNNNNFCPEFLPTSIWWLQFFKCHNCCHFLKVCLCLFFSHCACEWGCVRACWGGGLSVCEWKRERKKKRVKLKIQNLIWNISETKRMKDKSCCYLQTFLEFFSGFRLIFRI